MKVLIPILIGLLVVGCGKKGQPKSSDQNNRNSEETLSPLSPLEQKILGTYRIKGGGFDNDPDLNLSFNKNRELIYYQNGSKVGTASWSVKSNEVQTISAPNKKGYFRIEPNGDLTLIAQEENGKRKVVPEIAQQPFKKLRANDVATAPTKKILSNTVGKNLGTLHKALTGYAIDRDGKIPPIDGWCDAIIKVGWEPEIFISPKLPKPPKGDNLSHYSLNKGIVGHNIFDVDDMVLVFECDLGWNGGGGLKDAIKYMEKRKLKSIAICLANGDPFDVNRENLEKLKWGP